MRIGPTYPVRSRQKKIVFVFLNTHLRGQDGTSVAWVNCLFFFSSKIYVIKMGPRTLEYKDISYTHTCVTKIHLWVSPAWERWNICRKALKLWTMGNLPQCQKTESWRRNIRHSSVHRPQTSHGLDVSEQVQPTRALTETSELINQPYICLPNILDTFIYKVEMGNVVSISQTSLIFHHTMTPQ